MPINIRDAATADRAGNQFVPARIVMNVGDDDAEGRLRRVSKHLAAVRQEPALRWVNSVSAAIQRLGVPISRRIIGGMMKVVDVLASNVAGPPCPLYLAGEHVEEFYAFGPPAGAALNITLFSYDSTVHLGVTTVAAAVESRRQFMSCLDEAIAEMATLASRWTKEGTPTVRCCSASPADRRHGQALPLAPPRSPLPAHAVASRRCRDTKHRACCQCRRFERAASPASTPGWGCTTCCGRSPRSTSAAPRVVLDQRRRRRLREQVTREQRARGLVEPQPALPAVRNVGRRKETKTCARR